MNKYCDTAELINDIFLTRQLAEKLPQPDVGIVRRRLDAEKSLFALKDANGLMAVGYREDEENAIIFYSYWSTRLIDCQLLTDGVTYGLIMRQPDFGKDWDENNTD